MAAQRGSETVFSTVLFRPGLGMWRPDAFTRSNRLDTFSPCGARNDSISEEGVRHLGRVTGLLHRVSTVFHDDIMHS